MITIFVGIIVLIFILIYIYNECVKMEYSKDELKLTVFIGIIVIIFWVITCLV